MRYNLESMLPEKAFSPRGGRGPFSHGMTLEGGGGNPGPSSSTTVTSNIPEYAEPYVTNMLDLTQRQLFKMDNTGITGFEPYQPYSANVQDYFAGFSPLQKQAQIDAGAMQQPGQFALGSGLAGSAGIRSLGAAGQYGQDVTNKQRVDAAGNPMFDANRNPVFDASNKTQSFMSPYQQAVTNAAKSSAYREAQMAQNAQNLGAARTGTYGGARQLLANTERERNLLTNLTNIETQGAQSAYDRAMQTQQFGAGLGMQGYGQALGAGQALGQLGATQQGADIARQNQMATMGGQQQALEQNKINQSIQDYSTQQQYPLMQLGFMSNMLRGLPMEGLSRQTYAPQPSYLTQGIGTVGALGSLASAFKGREGGLPKDFEAPTGIKAYTVGGSVESKLQDMSPADLQNYIKETSSPMARQIAEKVLRDKTGRAGGGIIAFQNRGEVEDKDKEDREKVRQAYIDAAIAERPTFDKSESRKLETKDNIPLTERLGRALGIKDAGRQMLTKETTAMPMRSDGSDVPMVARSPELTAAEIAPVNPASIVAATPPRAEPKAEPKAGTKSAEARAESKAESKAAPATTGGGTGIKAVPSDKIMPTAGLTIPDTDSIDVSKIRAKALAEKEAYMGPNIAAQQDKARLMAEKSNAKDEASRISSLRMAEFFAAWGSTPGSTIVAGLYTLRNKIPDFVSDQKEETRIRRAIDKDIAELEKIDRLEKSSNYDAATNTAEKLKSELSKNALQKYGYDIKALSDANQTAAYREAAKNKGAGGAGGEDRALNNLIGKRNEINKSITTAKDKLRPGVKLTAAKPDSKDSKEQEKIVAARAEVAKATGSLENDLKQINALINTYGKIQGLETPTPGNDPLNIRKP